MEMQAIKKYLARNGLEWHYQSPILQSDTGRDGVVPSTQSEEPVRRISGVAPNNSNETPIPRAVLEAVTGIEFKDYTARFPCFTGDVGKWDSWRQGLELELRRRAMILTTEKDKIKFIMDHCQNTAYYLTRCYTNAETEYGCEAETATKMIRLLKYTFGPRRNFTDRVDAVQKAYAYLDSDDSRRDFMDRPSFLSIFIDHITVLDLSDEQKFHYLRDKVGRYKVNITEVCEDYEQLMDCLCKWKPVDEDEDD
ncbi:MAG: hypothetical protein MMC33_009037 [Icmadophila ericetorum]|nr:hypothetical protein [Icmadophila ericetorum]